MSAFASRTRADAAGFGRTWLTRVPPVPPTTLADVLADARAADRDHDWSRATDLWCLAIMLAGPSATPAMYESAERGCELTDRLPESLGLARQAVERLGAAADQDTLVRLHDRLAFYLAANGADTDAVFAALKIAIDIGELREPTEAYIQSLLTGVGVLHELGHERARNELLARAIAATHETDNVRLLKGYVLPWVAYLRLMSGNVNGCLQSLLQAWALEPRVDDPTSTVVVATLLLDVLRRLDRLNGLDAVARRGLDAVVRGGLAHTAMAACLRRNVAAALTDLGRHGDAAAVLDSAAR
jgi:hypothetical protein